MRPDDAAAAFLWDALSRARSVETLLTGVSWESYESDTIHAAATERMIEVIGEALGNLRRAAPELAARIPDIHRIIGMRNVLIHGYAEVNHRTVWTAATVDVPMLIPQLAELLSEVDPSAGASPESPPASR
jgi:uncharacterized protein with HEPN domain